MLVRKCKLDLRIAKLRCRVFKAAIKFHTKLILEFMLELGLDKNFTIFFRIFRTFNLDMFFKKLQFGNIQGIF